MTKLSLLYKLLGIGIFFTIISTTYQLYFHPRYSDYLDAHHASYALKQNLEKLKNDFAKRNAYTTQFTQTQVTYNQTMVAFPPDITTALTLVKKAGESAHLQVQFNSPDKPTSRGFYSEVSVHLTLLGTYQNMLDFMQTTSASTWNGPLFIWKNWTLTHQSTPNTTVLNETVNHDLLQMDVNALFFTMP